MNLDIKIDFMKAVESPGPVEKLDPEMNVVISDIWSKKVRLLGSEAIRLGMEHSTVRFNFIIRERNDISEEMYVKHGDEFYNVIGYENLEDDPNYMLIATIRKQVAQ